MYSTPKPCKPPFSHEMTVTKFHGTASLTCFSAGRAFRRKMLAEGYYVSHSGEQTLRATIQLRHNEALAGVGPQAPGLDRGVCACHLRRQRRRCLRVQKKPRARRGNEDEYRPPERFVRGRQLVGRLSVAAFHIYPIGRLVQIQFGRPRVGLWAHARHSIFRNAAEGD